MVANFGEALLAGLGVTNEIARSAIVRCHQDLADVLDPLVPVGPNNECREIFTAGATLWKLLLIRGLFDDYSNQQTLDLVLHSKALKAEYAERLNLCVPRPIAQIIRQATERDLKLRFQNLQELTVALESLSPQYLAADTKVREWLSDIAGDYLSDVQRSSGVRRVPLNLRASLATLDSGGRPSFIPTPLPGFHQPFIARPPAATIPSIIAPAAPEAQPDQSQVAPVVQDLSAAPTKRSPILRVTLVALALTAAISAGYALTHRAQVHALADKFLARAISTRLQPKAPRANLATVPTVPSNVSREGANLPIEGSSDAPNDQAKNRGSAGQDTNPNDTGSTAKSTSHLKHRGPWVKPNASPTPTPSGTNRWGI